MPNTFYYYAYRFLFYITLPFFAVCLYLFGSSPGDFDLIYISALVVSCAICWRDKDTLGALTILLGLWGLSRIMFLSLETSVGIIFTYIVSLTIIYFCLKQHIAKFALLLTLFSLGCEIYWVLTNYNSKPLITYFVGTMTLIILARELLFKRVFLAYRYFGFVSGKIALDWQLRGVLLADCVLVIAMLGEYFVRHILFFTNVNFIYYNFSSLAIFLSCITLVIVYMHYFHNQALKHLLA